MSFTRRTRSSATSAEIPHISLASYSRPSKRARKDSYKVEEAATGDVTSPALPKTEESTPLGAVPPKKRRRAKGDYADLGSDPLTDRIREDLDVLFCGENPDASPHNHFYKAVHAAGLTPTVLVPSASRTFPEDYNIGITNLIPRPTREASELTKAELEAAVPLFLQKVIKYRPRIVAFIGMKVGDTVAHFFAKLAGTPEVPHTPTSTAPSSTEKKSRKPAPVKAAIGLQAFALAHSSAGPPTYFYVLPSTSGRVAAYPLPVKLELYRSFGVEVAKLRSCPPAPLALPESTRYYSPDDLGLEVVTVKEEESPSAPPPPPRSTATPPRRSNGTSSPHFKRKSAEDAEADLADAATTPTKKKKRPARPYADPSQYAELGDDPLPDYLEEGLDVLLCGINPGVKSAQMRLHYASPTNHFWKCLAGAGFTDGLLHPSQGPTLPSVGVGSTNLVQRPSAEARQPCLPKVDYRVLTIWTRADERDLHGGDARTRSSAVGKSRAVSATASLPRERAISDTEQSASSSPSKKRRPAMPKVKIGLQPAVITYPPEDTKDGRRQTTYIWCLPSSSARVVEYQLVDKIEIWKDLKRDIGLLSSGQSPLKSAEIAFAEYPIEAVLPPAREEITSPHFKVTPIKREDVGMSALGR
ncbi:hypothetical protein C6P46_001310 [Rhodotorula mucilaginosa]|uniref:Uracil-DNA glycosylase-like domain-containing protein n=1 Tax=Rhodotorula mucilaginosa TaxID=5537 RepID=A0A9P6VVK0_RHOMI|nr:hypothetical protein C6P46_001310 [Rhodotorula mucilaginosa]